MALAPWDVLCAGKVRTTAEEERRAQTGEHGRHIFNPEWKRSERERAMCDALEVIARELGVEGNVQAGTSVHPYVYTSILHLSYYYSF